MRSGTFSIGTRHSPTAQRPSSFSGRKTLVVQAITEDGFIGMAHRTFIINPDSSAPKITLHTPIDSAKLTEESFPFTIKTTATDESGISFVDVLYIKEGQGGTKRIARISNPSTSSANRYDTIWKDSAGPGAYQIYAVAYDKTGNTSETPKKTITIE